MPAKRTFSDLRQSILACLRDGRKTVNDISTKTGINWKTVDNHLVYLCGKGQVTKVFDSPYVKIFELAHHGSHATNIHAAQGGTKQVSPKDDPANRRVVKPSKVRLR